MDDTRWRASNLADIQHRLTGAARARDGVLFQQQSGGHRVIVLKAGREIHLYFAEADPDADGALVYTGIMSRIDVTAPLKLLGRYTQVMMLALLWRPEPTRIYVAGFGGGRLPMALHHHFPRAEIDSTEIDPLVTTLAEQFFGIQQDDRVRIFTEDAGAFLANTETRYDIILVDCYTGAGVQPDTLADVAFYAACNARLVDGGVVATNIDLSDRRLKEKVTAFASAFPHTARFNDDVAHVLFGSAKPVTLETMRARADALAPLLGSSLPFRPLAERLIL